jgi:hypothetical protein
MIYVAFFAGVVAGSVITTALWRNYLEFVNRRNQIQAAWLRQEARNLNLR